MIHLNTAAQQIPTTLQQLVLLFKLTKPMSQKHIYWTLVFLAAFQDYLEDNIPPTNPTGIKKAVDSFQGDNPDQEPMKVDTNAEDPDRFNLQQNTDVSPNILYEKRHCETFFLSYRMNLPGTAEFIASRNSDKVALPNGNWEGSNDHDDKAVDIAWKHKTAYRLLGSFPQPVTLKYEGKNFHKSGKSAKTLLYGFYKNCNGHVLL